MARDLCDSPLIRARDSVDVEEIRPKIWRAKIDSDIIRIFEQPIPSASQTWPLS